MIRCLNCMRNYDEEFEVCPHCGFIRGTKPKEPYHLQPGMILAGKYVVGTVIGFGGFGVIYRAWDQNLETVVAVKEYYPTTFLSRITGEKQVNVYDKKSQQAFDKGKREFMEEARNMAKFNSHPNIVHVYDFFEENGTAYFVMEYLDGCNLKTFMQTSRKRGTPVSVDTALEITQAVLSALKETHAAGIIHRDIKPGNIFICKNGTIKLIDFGAARFSDSESEKTRTIIITPGYAPAEQYQTKSRQGAFTDIYAVAAVLYELLTGIKPDESINRKIEDLVEEPRVLNPQVPQHISNAVMRAMAIQPEIRFQNVEQFSKALRSRKEIRNARAEIRYRKRRRIFSIMAMVLAVLAGGIFCVLQFWNVRREAILDPAVVSIWIPAGEDGEEETKQLLQNMSDEYLQNNDKISIEITAIESQDYEKMLRDALKEGNGPVLFDSSCLNGEDYTELAALDKLVEFSLFQPDDYYLLGKYEEYFPSKKQFPLTFDVPVVYKNSLLEQDEDEDIYSGELFLEQKVSRYIGGVEDYRRIQEELPGIYELELPENAEGMSGSFCNLWSISADTSESEYAAAIRLLYYFLSETAQDYLTVQHDNFLPLNKNVMKAYLDVNNDFAGLEAYMERLDFTGEE